MVKHQCKRLRLLLVSLHSQTSLTAGDVIRPLFGSLLSDKEVTSFINTESTIACTKESPSTAQRDTKAAFCGLDWQKTVDMCSCMFCVRAVCYHCTDEEEENQRWVDDHCYFSFDSGDW